MTIPIVDHIGQTRMLMPLDRQKVSRMSYSVFGDPGSPSLIPRDQWRTVNLKSQFLGGVRDQKDTSACNAFATVECLEIARAAAGMTYVKLSPGYLYGNINGQVDQGSNLEDAIARMVKSGTCSAATVPELAWRSSNWPPSAVVEALKYRVLEWWLCPTFEHVVSAIMSGYAVNVGIQWGAGDNPDADGWLPNRVTSVEGGHAICRCSLENRNGKWGVGGPNSWSVQWGNAGWFTLSETRMVSEQGQYGWFATRAGTLPDGSGFPSLDSPTL